MQGAYLVVAAALFIIAAFTSLIHPPLGQAILFLALVAILTFIGNGVIWSLVYTFVVPYLEKRKVVTKRKK